MLTIGVVLLVALAAFIGVCLFVIAITLQKIEELWREQVQATQIRPRQPHAFALQEYLANYHSI